MHELSLLEGVLSTLEDSAQTHGFRQVKHIWLEIGQLSCVEPEALRFGFKAVMKNTLAEAAELTLIEQPGHGHCCGCQETVAIDSLYAPCPLCGHHQVQITEGMAMRVKELEVE